MPMTGLEMRELRITTGLTQAQFAEEIGVSRKTVNEAEGIGDGFLERRMEVAVRAITRVAKARSRLVTLAEEHERTGDEDSARSYRYAANLLRGSYASDEDTIFNLAVTAAQLRQELDRSITRTAWRP
ncbi:MAG: hypothetical protein QOG72_812 [Sphingomonadales bacterium]|jgi:transcriptional regulator with XRE-family HTH domain|nr:hypothetical protein [Sphingomonadales bacterium]